MGALRDPADVAGVRRLIVLIHNPGIETGDDLSARSRANCTRAVRDEHMQDFGRTDRVENLYSEAFLKAMEQGSRESFAGGDTITN